MIRGSSRSTIVAISASRRVEYRMRTWGWFSCAAWTALGPASSNSATATAHSHRGDDRRASKLLMRLERELGAQLEEPRRQERQRLQPGSSGHEGIVVREHRAGIQQVVDIDTDPRPRPPELQGLAQP